MSGIIIKCGLCCIDFVCFDLQNKIKSRRINQNFKLITQVGGRWGHTQMHGNITKILRFYIEIY